MMMNVVCCYCCCCYPLMMMMMTIFILYQTYTREQFYQNNPKHTNIYLYPECIECTRVQCTTYIKIDMMNVMYHKWWHKVDTNNTMN